MARDDPPAGSLDSDSVSANTAPAAVRLPACHAKPPPIIGFLLAFPISQPRRAMSPSCDPPDAVEAALTPVVVESDMG